MSSEGRAKEQWFIHLSTLVEYNRQGCGIDVDGDREVRRLKRKIIVEKAQVTGANQLPARGVPAILVLLLFIVLNAGAIYFAWRYIIRGATTMFLP